ncbi:MAG: hypothetical protein J7545_05580 [Roseofilum sp. SBFL]|uniref:hypothetical protein n=1 Tax=unclassified Roseofilum TaxID=2620099 RepID=UPI001B1F5F91|nr:MULTISPECIES: hypothetical protein [unclassified Roseofilum]MBP0014831.1 hypothetical protein [Roseofilum sp. SID3]MBP0025324.1 hypothetical protein [Roseofilum sp. SID2]MBP0037713.1 hypothetical protein [Roseofilum sp. SID1]MBP0041433.1 hypothetical protein [Roseofilum sp. SBFL]
MTIILENLEPEILEKLQNKAISHGRTVTEEIKVILTEELVRDNEQNLTKKMDQSEWHKFIEETAGSINDEIFLGTLNQKTRLERR